MFAVPTPPVVPSSYVTFEPMLSLAGIGVTSAE